MAGRSGSCPAVAERAIQCDCLVRDGDRLTAPAGEPYHSIESPRPVDEADVLGMSVINSGDLHSVLRLLDLAGVPRRTADRIPGVHPLVVGGNSGLADPEPLADYLDVVAIGEAEQSLSELLRIVHAHRTQPGIGPTLHEQLARVPGLYVPSMYVCDVLPGGGVSAIRPKHPTVPANVTPVHRAAPHPGARRHHHRARVGRARPRHPVRQDAETRAREQGPRPVPGERRQHGDAVLHHRGTRRARGRPPRHRRLRPRRPPAARPHRRDRDRQAAPVHAQAGHAHPAAPDGGPRRGAWVR
nr:hypothetical protein [Streptomyces sp. SID4946]